MIASIDLQILLRLRPFPMRGHRLLSFTCEHAIAESRCFADNCNSWSHVLIFCQGFSVLFSNAMLYPSNLIFILVETAYGMVFGLAEPAVVVMHESMLVCVSVYTV